MKKERKQRENISCFRKWKGLEYNTTIEELGNNEFRIWLWGETESDGLDTICPEIQSIRDLCHVVLNDKDGEWDDGEGNKIQQIGRDTFLVWIFGDCSPETFEKEALQELVDLFDQVLEDTQE